MSGAALLEASLLSRQLKKYVVVLGVRFRACGLACPTQVKITEFSNFRNN
jgi:hypothetical protein